MNFIFKIFTISLLFFALSCSYKMVRVTTVDGKKIWIKDYINNEEGEKQKIKDIFKHNKGIQVDSQYSGMITTDTTHASTFIQFDSVRVYLFGQTSEYKQIFTTGLLSGQNLYCVMDSLCRPVENAMIRINMTTGDTIAENLWGWTGHTIRIDYFKLLDNVDAKPTQRRFKFYVYPYKTRFNGCNDVMLLELTNETANKHTSLEEFIRGAHVTFLCRGWLMI